MQFGAAEARKTLRISESLLRELQLKAQNAGYEAMGRTSAPVFPSNTYETSAHGLVPMVTWGLKGGIP